MHGTNHKMVLVNYSHPFWCMRTWQERCLKHGSNFSVLLHFFSSFNAHFIPPQASLSSFILNSRWSSKKNPNGAILRPTCQSGLERLRLIILLQFTSWLGLLHDSEPWLNHWSSCALFFSECTKKSTNWGTGPIFQQQIFFSATLPLNVSTET